MASKIVRSVSKRIAIVQSSYIPWRGYFDLIASVDEFVLYDDVQFTKRDWRNRNRIKTPNGPIWLTIPVQVKGRFEQRVRDVVVSDSRWAEKHWRSIRAHYRRAPFFDDYAGAIEAMYAGASDPSLSQVNFHCLSALCRMLGITTPLTWSQNFALAEERTARLVGICVQAGATEYVSGPSASAYMDLQQFADVGISVTYADYSAYREYAQLYPPFDPAVSVIDLIVHTGPEALHLIRSQTARSVGAGG